MKIEGDFTETFKFYWKKEKVDNEQVKRSWQDSIEATELATTAIAIVLILELTQYTVIERSPIGTGYDYLLGIEETTSKVLIPKARLEVSGIGNETPTNTVKSRVNVKLKQTNKSDSTGFPAFVVVVEFKTPKVRIAIKQITT